MSAKTHIQFLADVESLSPDFVPFPRKLGSILPRLPWGNTGDLLKCESIDVYPLSRCSPAMSRVPRKATRIASGLPWCKCWVSDNLLSVLGIFESQSSSIITMVPLLTVVWLLFSVVALFVSPFSTRPFILKCATTSSSIPVSDFTL